MPDSRHRRRRMFELESGRWFIQCLLCGRRVKRVFATARECHQWWDAHVTTDKHQFWLSPEGREQREQIRREWRAWDEWWSANKPAPTPRPERVWTSPAHELADALMAISPPDDQFENRYEAVRFAREIMYRAEQGDLSCEAFIAQTLDVAAELAASPTQ